jgi:hypothetical protein
MEAGMVGHEIITAEVIITCRLILTGADTLRA